MQTRSRLFDDLAKVAGGAVSALSGIKAEIEIMIRQQIERLLVEADMVPRDEFDAVKAMAANARLEQEILEKRVRQLERKLGVKAPGKTSGKTRPAGGKKPAPKAAAKKAPAKKAKAAKPKKKSRPQSLSKKSRSKKPRSKKSRTKK